MFIAYVLDGVGGLGQIKGAIDDWIDRTYSNELGKCGKIVGIDLRHEKDQFVADERFKDESTDHAADYTGDRDFFTEHSGTDVRSIRDERAAVIGYRAVADEVEDNIVGFARAGEILERVIDHTVRAERANHLDILSAANGGDIGAIVGGDLHGKSADAAGSAVYYNCLPRRYFPRVAECLQRRKPGNRQRCRLLMRHTQRLEGNFLNLGAGVLGEGPVATAENRVAGCETRDLFSNRFDDARSIDAR
jgi:hypothetical protein